MGRNAVIDLCFGLAGLIMSAACTVSILREIRKGIAGLPYGGRVYRKTIPILFWVVTAIGAMAIPLGLDRKSVV